MDNHAVRWGLIAGGVGIIYLIVLYLINPVYMFYISLTILGVLITVYCMRRAAIDTRTDLGGYMTWGEGIKPTFITYTIAAFLVGLVTFIMFQIDDSLPSVLYDYKLELTAWGGELSGFSPEQIDVAIENFRNQESIEDNEMTLGRVIQMFLASAFFGGGILSAIVSFFIRRINQKMPWMALYKQDGILVLFLYYKI